MKALSQQATPVDYTLKIRPDIFEHYDEAGEDYYAWSKNLNMHFGYYSWGINPFRREKLLEKMNNKVLKSLNLKPHSHIIDFGCGMGATIRHGKKTYPDCMFTGVTILKVQVERGNELIDNEKLKGAGIIEADYAEIPLPDAYADAAYAIESICHASETHKEKVIIEMHRLLKPEGRIAIADCFEINSAKPMIGFMKSIYKKICSSWAVKKMADIDEFEIMLHSTGFRNIKTKNISLNIAPSVLHAPFLVTKFALEKWIKGEKLSKTRKDHLIASFLSLFLGMYRSRIGYYLITAEKI